MNDKEIGISKKIDNNDTECHVGFCPFPAKYTITKKVYDKYGNETTKSKTFCYCEKHMEELGNGQYQDWTLIL